MMYIALFSIKPIFADAILKGQKKYEFRTKRCKKDIKKIVIYATSPINKIVGEATVLSCLQDTPESLWLATKCYAGIEKIEYFNYFKNRNKAIAFYLEDPKRYYTKIALQQIGINYPPQSYCYLNNLQYQILIKLQNNTIC